MESMWGVKYWGFLHIIEKLLRLLRVAALRSKRGDLTYLVLSQDEPSALEEDLFSSWESIS